MRPENLEKHESDDDAQLRVERLLVKIVGRVFDINYHVLQNEYSIMPADYRKSFIELGRKIDGPEKLIKAVSNSAGLRNVLVHEYEEIDHKKVYSSISMVLEQIPQYLKIILDSLE